MNEIPTHLQNFFDRLNNLTSRGPRGPGMTNEKLKRKNLIADQRFLLMAMQRDEPETAGDAARIQAAVAKRERRALRPTSLKRLGQ